MRIRHTGTSVRYQTDWLTIEGVVVFPLVTDRYLQFDNIDMRKAEIHAHCSRCGQEFSATPKVGEKVDLLTLRLRGEFNGHKCRIPKPKFYDTFWK